MKKSAIIKASILTMLILTGCGTKSQNKEYVEERDQQTYTSEALGIYTAKINGELKAVNPAGRETAGYEIDEQGNICQNGEVKIKKEDAAEYKYVNALTGMSSDNSIQVELEQSIENGTVKQIETKPKAIEYRVFINPSDAFNQTVEISSSDASVVIPVRDLESKEKSNPMLIDPHESVATMYLMCMKEGSTEIMVKATDGSETMMNITVTVTEKKIEPAIVQTSDTDLIKTTENTSAWINPDIDIAILYEKPGDASDALLYCGKGKDLTVLGREGEWLKCSVNGIIGYMKKEYVTTENPDSSQTGVSENVQTTIEPAAKNDGKDHGFASGAETEDEITGQQDKETAENHSHYYIKYKVIPPTETERGYTIYRCECGSYYCTDYRDKT